MARIVLGLASCHAPPLVLSAVDWAHRAAADRADPAPGLSDGRLVNYEQLPAEVGPRHGVAIPDCGRSARGSSEILNWVFAAGAPEGLELTWSALQPLYRSPAGTGLGAGFAIWQSADPGTYREDGTTFDH